MKTIGDLGIIAICVCVLACGRIEQANGAHLGNIQADKILFLGNSITFCPQPAPFTGSWWGLSASTPEKDYAHLLTQSINAATGGSLAIVPPNPSQGEGGISGAGETRWYAGDPLPNYNGNIINMCDIFEINYNTWENARVQNQIDGQPDIVVVQLGENMTGGTPEQFRVALTDLLTGLKNSSNPQIFVTSFILGTNPTVDDIKRQVCALDPTHRVFVDLTAVRLDGSNMGAYGHPNDKGMQLIADKIFGAMVTHSVPEPTSIVLWSTALVATIGYVWRRRN